MHGTFLGPVISREHHPIAPGWTVMNDPGNSTYRFSGQLPTKPASHYSVRLITILGRGVNASRSK